MFSKLSWSVREFIGKGIKQHSEHQISESCSMGRRVGRFVGTLRRIRGFWELGYNVMVILMIILILI